MDKWILITGASRGIGKATAYELAGQNYNLVVTGRHLDNLKELAADLSEKHPNIQVVARMMDVREPEEIKLVFKNLLQESIVLSGLVNNAGIMKDATLMTAKPEDLMDIYNTNFFGTFYCSQSALKHFLRLRNGAIVNVASIVGVHGNNGQTMYASSKSAVIGFTKSLSKELAPLNIRVNAIAPGFIDTDMIRDVESKFYERNLGNIGFKRLGKASDVAKLISFLIGNESSYITGQVIGVDGGMIV